MEPERWYIGETGPEYTEFDVQGQVIQQLDRMGTRSRRRWRVTPDRVLAAVGWVLGAAVAVGAIWVTLL